MIRLALLIPSKDRHAALARSLRTVLPAARAAAAEVIVCDQSATAFAHPGVRVLHRPDLSGLPAARNVLLRATDADVVCFLDDDLDLADDFAVRLRALAEREPAVAGWGPVVETRPRAVRRLHRLVHLGALRDPRRLTGARLDAPTAALFGCCFAVRRALALRTGFDARLPGYALGEDLDFCRRLRAPLRFARDLRAVHRCEGAGRADPAARGRAKAAFLIRHARRFGGRNPVTVLHLLLALAAAAGGRGHERAAAGGVLAGVRVWLG